MISYTNPTQDTAHSNTMQDGLFGDVAEYYVKFLAVCVRFTMKSESNCAQCTVHILQSNSAQCTVHILQSHSAQCTVHILQSHSA